MSILAQILADKKPEVRAAMARRSLADVEAAARAMPAARDFAAALRRGSGESMRFLCEFKRASPSAGAIAAGAEPEPVVRQYAAGGASAISVLTDETYFDGRLEFLARVRSAVRLPILRKDFIVDPYQIAEAKAEGADAVLLIASALDQSELEDLYRCTREWGLHALVEVHDEAEAERAVSAGAVLIGVNHRNLATFEVDLGLTGRLAGQVPSHCILVGESGIKTREDVLSLREAGAHAVLIGETLMRAKEPARTLENLRGVQ